MVLPKTLKEYEQYCDYVIETTFDTLLILILGEQLKKQQVLYWKAIGEI
jgi:hypothetical protein